MTRLDKFIELMFLRGAEKLVLESGAAGCIELPGGVRQAVMQRVVSTAHIVSAVAELMPPYLAQGFSADRAEEFDYESPSGRVQVRFTPDGGSVVAEIVAATPESETAAAVRRKSLKPPEVSLQSAEEPEAPGEPVLKPAFHAVAMARPRPPRIVPLETVGSMKLSVPQAPAAAAEAMRELLDLCESRGASDLHLTSGRPPALRIDGDIAMLEGFGEPSPDRMMEMLWSITPDRIREHWLANKDADFAHETEATRFRVNLLCDRSGIAAVLRRIPGTVYSAEEMGIDKSLLDLCFLPKGLVLVTGPTGSGKSTTLAAMLDHVNRSRDDNIITIEDPIEFVHTPKRCQIHQREVGTHTASFKAALRAALREDPDVVLVGEMRDLETVSIALETAETGHLVFGTLHTNTAPSTVDRIIDQFPADRQSQIRTMLSESLKAVVTQTLCKKIGGGRIAAREVLLANAAVSNLIREGKTYQLPSTMQTGRGQGMQTLNDALLDLVRKKQIFPQEALSKSLAKAELRKAMESSGLTVEQVLEA